LIEVYAIAFILKLRGLSAAYGFFNIFSVTQTGGKNSMIFRPTTSSGRLRKRLAPTLLIACTLPAASISMADLTLR
jgi:hypothetical protein